MKQSRVWSDDIGTGWSFFPQSSCQCHRLRTNSIYFVFTSGMFVFQFFLTVRFAKMFCFARRFAAGFETNQMRVLTTQVQTLNKLVSFCGLSLDVVHLDVFHKR